MSFGFSVGDFVALIQLAKSTYKNCVEAGAEYIEIAREIRSLHSVLKPLRDEAQKHDSPLFSQDRGSAEELMTAIDGCKHILEDLQTLLAKFEGLSTDGGAVSTTRKLWHRFRFSTKIDQLGAVRGKIIVYTSTISVMLDGMQLRATGRVEERLNTISTQMMGGFEDLRKAIYGMAVKARTEQYAGSTISLLSLSTYAGDDKEVWCEFRRGLLAKGFRSKDLDRHKDLLQAYMLQLDQSGVLDEVQEVSRQKIVSPWWQKHAFAETVNSLPGLQSIHEEDNVVSLSQYSTNDLMPSLQQHHDKIEGGDRDSLSSSKSPLYFQQDITEDHHVERGSGINLSEYITSPVPKENNAPTDEGATCPPRSTDSEKTNSEIISINLFQRPDEVLISSEQKVKYDNARLESVNTTTDDGPDSPSLIQRNPYSSAAFQWAPPQKVPPTQSSENFRPPQISARTTSYSKLTLDGTTMKGVSDIQLLRRNDQAGETAISSKQAWQATKPVEKELNPQLSKEESIGTEGSPIRRGSKPGHEVFRTDFAIDNSDQPGTYKINATKVSSKRVGFMPSIHSGDEPPARRTSGYTTYQFNKQPEFIDPQYNFPVDPLGPEAIIPLQPRLTTPYATHGGEKTDIFNDSMNLNRARSPIELGNDISGIVSYGGTLDGNSPASVPGASEQRLEDDSTISGVANTQEIVHPLPLSFISKDEVNYRLCANEDFLSRRQRTRMDFQEQVQGENLRPKTTPSIHMIEKASFATNSNQTPFKLQTTDHLNPSPWTSHIQVAKDVTLKEEKKGHSNSATIEKWPPSPYVESESESEPESSSVEMDASKKPWVSRKSKPQPEIEISHRNFLSPNLSSMPARKVSSESMGEPRSTAFEPSPTETRGRLHSVEPEGSKRRVRIVSPPPEVKTPEEIKFRGILRQPRESFPEDPRPIREGIAQLKNARKTGVPLDARWTKIDRRLVNPEALEVGKERFEFRKDFVIVLRVLTKEEIQGYAQATQEIRAARQKMEGLMGEG